MKKINEDVVADIDFIIRWGSDKVKHTEAYTAHTVNFWRDCLPQPLLGQLNGKMAGDTIEVDFEAGKLVSAYDPRNTVDIKQSQFNRRFGNNGIIEPRAGRFYPKGILNGLAGIFPQNFHPFRCVGIQNDHLRVDFNHPLAEKKIQLRAIVKDVRVKGAERGGSCRDWMDLISNGPGMQARWKEQPTDFFADNPFQRADETSDVGFYQQPRFVQHLDDTAIRVVTDIYARLLKDGMRVLDLMSSWTSHLPDSLRLKKLTGLGLNRQELDKNVQLTDRFIHDLNENLILPFDAQTYDAAVCTVSVEYLVQPVATFREIARVLKPGGRFILTFSNRWFSSKVINIWKEMHDFERMGLVLEYFRASECFKDLETFSMRGLPRPWDDKYYSENKESDPVYAVWGSKA